MIIILSSVYYFVVLELIVLPCAILVKNQYLWKWAKDYCGTIIALLLFD